MAFLHTKLDEFINTNLNSNFIKWFNGSKMVRNDKPIVFYNGSNKKFNKFKYGKITDRYKNNILGFYFADTRHIAEMYGKNIISCYLSIKNPKKYSDTDFQIHLNYKTSEDLVKLKEVLISEGYDGIVYPSIVVCFSPNQIKSIDNNGNFDINDNNIYS